MHNTSSSMLIIFLVSMTLNGYTQNSEVVMEDGIASEDYYVDGVVKKSITEEAMVPALHKPREIDVSWEKRLWRTIDVREKMNMTFRSPKNPFFSILKDLVKNGDVVAFKDETFRDPLLEEDLMSRISRIDTVTTIDPELFVENVSIIENDLNWEDVKQFRIKEVWYFDKQLARMKSRILGIAPLIDRIDIDTGTYKYTEVLFWIYYPEAVNYLAKLRVENDKNDVSPMTWYDLFEMRMFSSYITKKSNVLDMRIKDMVTHRNDLQKGVDRLLASDKIHVELFNFEHDLWEY